ncbi:MAG TPA: hypothetical protein VGW35_17320 [Methylomirabilota bacterium]|jgi:hypothetical protein|nr:hypothetical protein [Methylomirabilota bacterium]
MEEARLTIGTLSKRTNSRVETIRYSLTGAHVLKRLPYGLEEAALDATTKDGQPAAVAMNLTGPRSIEE